VTVMSPSGEIRILSSPRGPSEVLTMFATVFAAKMCDLTASLPCCLFFFPWLRAVLALALVPCFAAISKTCHVLSDNDKRPARLILHHLRCIPPCQRLLFRGSLVCIRSSYGRVPFERSTSAGTHCQQPVRI
jgi:hypothetical protein